MRAAPHSFSLASAITPPHRARPRSRKSRWSQVRSSRAGQRRSRRAGNDAAAREFVGPARPVVLGRHDDDRSSRSSARAAARSATADRSATSCSTSPASPDRPSAPGASRPVIRGLDNFRVRVQENGTSTLDVSEIGEDHAVPVDTLSADRVEVVRGPATLRYGSQAIGGVVSIDNNRIPMPTTPFGFSGRIGSAFTSVDRGGEGSVAMDARGKDVAMHLDAFARRSGDYRIPGGIQANSSVSAEGGAVGGSAFFNGGFFGLALTNTRSVYHIPGIESALEQYAHRSRTDEAARQGRVSSRLCRRRRGAAVVRRDGIPPLREGHRRGRHRRHAGDVPQPRAGSARRNAVSASRHADRRLDRCAGHPVQSPEPRHQRRSRLVACAERNHGRRSSICSTSCG